MAALGRSHTHGGEPLYQLDIAISHARCVDDVFDLQVFVEIDKFSTLGVLQERPRMIDLLGTVDVFNRHRLAVMRHPQIAQCLSRRVPTVGFYQIQREDAVDTAGEMHALGQIG